MGAVITKTREQRLARHRRVRKKVAGTAARPRLAVFRSSTHIYAQLINDAEGRTMASASSVEGEVRGQRTGKKKKEVAEIVGGLLAERAKGAGVSQVVFDRGGFKYHGRVQALADAARKGGLVF
ncbi:MAG: 50S ribosomal protein L18 [Dehalococcoidia bacterium]|nr:50S ribosomal protein L18 [Dehalococcoidia bacterium]